MKFLRFFVILLKGIIVVPLRILYATSVDKQATKKSSASSTKFHGKPDSFAKGEAFEKYVRSKIFTKDRYVLTHKTHGYEENSNDFVESSLEPDYRFRCKETNREFYVEVKFRSSTYEGKYEWSNHRQMNRYKGVKDEKPTFLMLGMGGTPDYPNGLALIPLNDINFTGLFPSFISKYKLELDNPVNNKYLWSLLSK